jgi:hypothetical protein
LFAPGDCALKSKNTAIKLLIIGPSKRIYRILG